MTSMPERGSPWEQAANYEKEERSMRPVRLIVVKGAVDVVFYRASTAHLVVAGETQDAISSIQTRFESNTLVIEQKGASISMAGGSIHVSGSGHIVAGRDIYIDGVRQSNSRSIGVGRSIVGIALPEAPAIRIQGSGDVTLYDLQQSLLTVGIQGSGDVTAIGHVKHLVAEVAGSGDVDASELVTATAELSVAGSGDIEANIHQSVKARVAGSGDILIRGNPAIRDHSVAGSGDIMFKK